MSVLVLAVVAAAIGVGGVVRGLLPADSQFTFVVVALGVLALLFGLAAYISACRDNGYRPARRPVAEVRPYRSLDRERVAAAAQSARWSR